MRAAKSLLSLVALTCLSVPTWAATTVYTSSPSFLSNVAPGAYTENFNTLGVPPDGPLTFTGGAFTYVASAPGDMYSSLATGFLGTNETNQPLTITFSTGNVTAFGANFFATNFSDEFVGVSITLTLSDGTVETFTPASAAESYRGFVSTTPIKSLLIDGPGLNTYGGLDNFTVGSSVSAVPEPNAMILLSVGLAGLLVMRRRAR